MNEESTREWIRKAESDLKIGKDELTTADPATDAICFHMQQCAEKYLKAFLVFNGREIRRTHIIEDLIKECMKTDERFRSLADTDAVLLTPYAVEIRYPADAPPPSLEMTKQAIRAAETVKQFVLGILEEKGFSP